MLHVLSQRPLLTGSGVTLDALVRGATESGWDQHAIVGIPRVAPGAVGGLAPDRIHALEFGEGADLGFELPGMSDVMPYPSTRFSAMSPLDIERYECAWRAHVAEVITRVQPDLIHTHHIWLLSALLPDLARHQPIVAHCHATGLRQMELCPHLAPRVIEGCRRIDRFVVLHAAHRESLAERLGVGRERIEIVGAGYREDIFHARGRLVREARDARRDIVYVGKLARAKGLLPLLDAFERIAVSRSGVRLHLIGSGSGSEAAEIRARAEALGDRAVLHGAVSQSELGPLLRTMDVCVLPSFYEGLPLVLVEALACGCRLVSSALPGVVEQIAPSAGDAIELVELPRLISVDQPLGAELPAYTARLAAALERALDCAIPHVDSSRLESFTWSAVYRRIEHVWRELLADD